VRTATSRATASARVGYVGDTPERALTWAEYGASVDTVVARSSTGIDIEPPRRILICLRA
jgi:hypothetical protein